MATALEHGRSSSFQSVSLDRERTWSLDARAAMFVLEAATNLPPTARERNRPRLHCRVEATVGDAVVYLRDLDPQHAGFIVDRELPVGSTVQFNINFGDQSALRTPATVRRSREFMAGWYEGALDFSESHDELANLELANLAERTCLNHD